MAGDRRGCLAEGIAEALFALKLLEESGHLFDDISCAEAGGDGADQRRTVAEGLCRQAEPRKGFTVLCEAFCRLAAEAQGGRIWVEDRAGHGGASFCVRIPQPTA